MSNGQIMSNGLPKGAIILGATPSPTGLWVTYKLNQKTYKCRFVTDFITDDGTMYLTSDFVVDITDPTIDE